MDLIDSTWRSSTAGTCFFRKRRDGVSLLIGVAPNGDPHGGWWWRAKSGSKTLAKGKVGSREEAASAAIAVPMLAVTEPEPEQRVTQDGGATIIETRRRDHLRHDYPRECLWAHTTETLLEISRELGGPTSPRTKRVTLIRAIPERRRIINAATARGEQPPTTRQINALHRAQRDESRQALAEQVEQRAQQLEAQARQMETAPAGRRLGCRTPGASDALARNVERARANLQRAERELEKARAIVGPSRTYRIECAERSLRIARAKLTLVERASAA